MNRKKRRDLGKDKNRQLADLLIIICFYSIN